MRLLREVAFDGLAADVVNGGQHQIIVIFLAEYFADAAEVRRLEHGCRHRDLDFQSGSWCKSFGGQEQQSTGADIDGFGRMPLRMSGATVAHWQSESKARSGVGDFHAVIIEWSE